MNKLEVYLGQKPMVETILRVNSWFDKECLYKSLGKSILTVQQMKEVLVEARVILNKQLLGYLEDDIQLTTLKPNGYSLNYCHSS